MAFAETVDYVNMTPKSLWSQLKNDLHEHYGFELEGSVLHCSTKWESTAGETCYDFVHRDAIDAVLAAYNLRRTFVLRQFCRKVGIQIVQRDYNLSNKKLQPFTEDDIVNLFPIVKCVSPLVSQTRLYQKLVRTLIWTRFPWSIFFHVILILILLRFAVFQLKIIHEARSLSASALKNGNMRAALDILSDCLSSQSVIQGGISSELALLYFETAQLHYLSEEVPFVRISIKIIDLKKAVNKTIDF